MIPPRPSKDGPSNLDGVADEDAWLRSVFREEELEASGQQRGPSSEQSDAAQDVDMDPQQRTTEDSPDVVIENAGSSRQGGKRVIEPSGQTVSLSNSPREIEGPVPARRTDWYSMWDNDDPAELVDAALAKFKGLPARAYNSSDVMDLLADTLNLLPAEQRARGIATLQVVTRHHLHSVETLSKARIVSPTAGASVGPAHEAPSSVLAPPRPTASAAASAANEAPSSILAPPLPPNRQLSLFPPPPPGHHVPRTVVAVAAVAGGGKRQRVAGGTPDHPRRIVTPAPPAPKAKAKAKANTPPGPVRAALEKAKKSAKRSCVVELRSDDVDAVEMDAPAFMAFRNRVLGLLGSKVVINSTFPLKGGIGLVLNDDTQGMACVEALNRAQGYTAKVRTGLWPRIILFGPAVNRGITIDNVDRMIRESNPDLVKDIGGSRSSSSSTVNPPATGLVSTIYWRGQHLVLSVNPILYSRLSSRGEGKGHLVLNHLRTRWATSKSPAVCFRCCGIGHIGPACPHKQDPSKIRCTRCAAFGHERQSCPAQAITGPVQKCANCLDHNASLTGTGGRRKVDHECTDSACESLTAFAKRQWGRTDFGGATSSLW